MRGARVTTMIDQGVSDQLRALATERAAAVSRLIEEALREYLSTRPVRSGADLLARLTRTAAARSALSNSLESPALRSSSVAGMRRRIVKPSGGLRPGHPSAPRCNRCNRLGHSS